MKNYQASKLESNLEFIRNTNRYGPNGCLKFPANLGIIPLEGFIAGNFKINLSKIKIKE